MYIYIIYIYIYIYIYILLNKKRISTVRIITVKKGIFRRRYLERARSYKSETKDIKIFAKC